VGRNVSGKDVLIVDDMIASGESVLDIAKELKKRNARNVYVAATFGFFTEGTEKFTKAYEEGLISRIYSTNLTYIPESLLKEEWFRGVDMSELSARIINRLNHGRSIAKYMDATRIIQNLLNK
jgi:ribose-phosphate pyrophosphokinase